MNLAMLDAFVRDKGWNSAESARSALALADVSFWDCFEQWLFDPSRSSAGREWVHFAFVQQRNMELFYLACKRGDFSLLLSVVKVCLALACDTVRVSHFEFCLSALNFSPLHILSLRHQAMTPVWLHGNNYNYLQRGTDMLLSYACRWSPAVRETIALVSLVPAYVLYISLSASIFVFSLLTLSLSLCLSLSLSIHR